MKHMIRGNYLTSSDPHSDKLFSHSFWHIIWKYIRGLLYIPFPGFGQKSPSLRIYRTPPLKVQLPQQTSDMSEENCE